MASYEFIVRGMLGGIGMSSFGSPDDAGRLGCTPSAHRLASRWSLCCASYFIGIHRRFWEMPVWKATALYLVAASLSNQIGFWLMWYVGYYCGVACSPPPAS